MNRMAALLLSATLCLPSLLTATTVPQITLPAGPPSSRTVTPVEMWRVGGEDDDEILLGLVTAAVQGPDGNTYLLDMQLAQVLVISPDGELVTTLGREGAGPGELRRPHSLFFLDDHTLAVVQGFPGRITLLNLDGTPAGTITPGQDAAEGGFSFLRKVLPAPDRLVAQQGRATFDQDKGTASMEAFLAITDRQGAEITRLVSHTRENDLAKRVFDEKKEFSEMSQWTVTPGGIIYTTPERDAYVLAAYDLEGNRLHVLRRPFTPRKRTDKDKESITSGVVMRVNGRRVEVESHVLDTDPAIMGLHAAADGRLFVTNCLDRAEVLPEGIGARYDVISPDGEFIEELSLAIPGFDPDNDEITFLDGVRFLLLRNVKSAADAMRAGLGIDNTTDEDDLGDVEPLEAVLYRLP